tara:strand:+ start:111 stop:1556 length:1446 start_codon:yes stop_codon:yes gene_type:complete
MNNILIIGGGNSGYISALMLKKSFPNKNIGVIYSQKIGTIGVGESSSEQIAEFCKYCDIPKLSFIVNTKATFKRGIYFENWAKEDFLHSIETPFAEVNVNRFLYYQQVVANERPNHEMQISWENKVNLDVFEDYDDSPTNQFHFDTQSLNEYLKHLCTERGIILLEDEIVECSMDSETGRILSVSGSQDYPADFFIDCSGFSRLLVNKKLGVKWKSYSEYLPLNSAIAFSTDEMDEYNIYTKSTARDYGWSWKIPTQDRTGNGYVFCDRFINEDQAHQEMEKVYGHKIDVAKTFKFDSGRLEKAWYKNCYAVGLSQSFIEPLEATALGSVVQQMFAFIHCFPSYSEDECNELVDGIFDNMFDFVQAHYLTKREDTSFWKEVKYDLKITPSLQKSLDKWKRRFPQTDDVSCRFGMFYAVNYIPILYGLKWFDRDVIDNESSHLMPVDIVNYSETHNLSLTIGHKDFIKGVIKSSPLLTPFYH